MKRFSCTYIDSLSYERVGSTMSPQPSERKTAKQSNNRMALIGTTGEDTSGEMTLLAGTCVHVSVCAPPTLQFYHPCTCTPHVLVGISLLVLVSPRSVSGGGRRFVACFIVSVFCSVWSDESHDNSWAYYRFIKSAHHDTEHPLTHSQLVHEFWLFRTPRFGALIHSSR